MIRLAGAALIIAGGVLSSLLWQGQRRRETELLRELNAALEDMESIIRWQKLPLPRAFAAQQGRALCGAVFQRTLEEMERGMPLQDSWTVGAALLEGEAARILACVQWGGDEQHILTQIHGTAHGLEKLRQEKLARQARLGRLPGALALGGAAILIILLL